jgi:hypothetical protein
VVFVLDELSTYTTPRPSSESGWKHEALLNARRRLFMLTLSGEEDEEAMERNSKDKTAHLNHIGQLRNNSVLTV